MWGKMKFLMPVSVFSRLTHRLANALGTLFGGIFGVAATTSTIVPKEKEEEVVVKPVEEKNIEPDPALEVPSPAIEIPDYKPQK